MGRMTLIIAALIAIAGFVALSAIFTVHQTQQAIVLQFGDPKRVVKEPGLHFKLPFIQNVEYFDRRILDLRAPAGEIIASDQKRLVVDSFARYRIVQPLEFFRTVVDRIGAEGQLRSLLESSLREVLGAKSFFAVLSGERAELMVEIRNRMNNGAQNIGIEIVDVRIRRADLPEANSQAIYRRMQTEREREAREFRAQGAEIAQRIRSRADREVTVLLAEAQRDSDILRGEGEGERNRIFADAFGRDPDFFVFYRSMKAYEKALKANDTTLILSPDSEFFRFFRDVEGGPSGGR